MKPTPQAIQEGTRELGPLMGRAVFDPATINKDARTVEVVFATENPVSQSYYDYSRDSYATFTEILSMNPAHVRMARITGGAPVLNNHSRWEGVKGQLGKVEKAWLSGTEARAILRFSKRSDVEEIWNDVVDGILTGISVGYRVYAYEITRKEGELDVYRAVDWEPFEISFAPVQADIKSGVRSADKEEKPALNTITIRLAPVATVNRNITLNPTMTPEEIAAAAAAAANPDATRSATVPPQPPPVNTAELQRQAIAGERMRVKEITDAVRAASLEQSFADTLVNDGHDINKARELIIAEFAKKDPAAGQRGTQQTIRTGADETDKRREAMEIAMIHRAAPSAIKADQIRGNEYRGLSLLRMAEACIVAAGGSGRGMTSSELAREALNLRSGGGISTSDFPIILGNTVNRRLQAEYALAPQTFQEWTSRGSATDFKEMTRAYMTELGDMKEIKEGGEYKAVSMGEGKEVYRVFKYGNKIIITWETLVNDDLSAFNRLPAMIAQTAKRKQSDIVYGILAANANMGDGVPLFHATHGNLMTAAAISDVSLAEGRKLMRLQKGKGNKDFLNLSPSFLLVGPEKETEALKYTSAEYLPTTQAQVNPWKSLSIVVEPRITGNAWYQGVRPGVVDTIEYAFLDGEELTVETRQGFDVDGVETKARMVFGAKALDWKGLNKNVGN